MDENTVETTQQNPEETTSAEETQEQTPVEKETPKEKTETYTERERRYHARMKEAEEAAKKAREELAKTKEEAAKAKLPISDIDAILEVNRATNGLDAEEIAELKLRASSLGTSLSEARENKNFQIWQKSYREMVAKEKTPPPSTTPPEAEKKTTFVEKLNKVSSSGITQDVANLSEKEKLLEEKGLWKSPRKRADKTYLSEKRGV